MSSSSGRRRPRPRRLAAFVVLLTAATALGVAAVRDGAPTDGPIEASTVDVRASGLDREDAWAPLTLLPVVDPTEYGAVGDGVVDDTAALQRAIDSVPDGGGIIWLAPGRSYRTTDVIRITGDHVKLWAPNGQAELRPSAGVGERRHALIIDGAAGAGLFGVTFRSDGEGRRTALEDSTVVLDGASSTELVGLEITGSPSAAIFVFGASRDTWVAGNDLYDNWADAVHFTDGSRQAWVWDNVIVNDGPTLGDDGVACVTYGDAPRCGSMEWWGNTHLGGGWGRGLAVVGGDTIHIHDNVVLDTAAAGILVASEPSYDTPGSDTIRIEGNVVCRAGHTVPHPGILVSGLDGPIVDVDVIDNVVVDGAAGRPFGVEGEVIDLVERGTSNVEGDDCAKRAGRRGRAARDTSTLTTRDASIAPEPTRRGLARIHIRPRVGGGFEQQVEYVVAGSSADIDEWLVDRRGSATRYRVEDGGATADEYLVFTTGRPVLTPSTLRQVEFAELRDLALSLPALWDRVDGPGR